MQTLCAFLKKFLRKEVWQLQGSQAYRSYCRATAELCPAPPGALGGLRCSQVCPHFDGFHALGCPEQERCCFAHARGRLFL